MSHDTEEKNRNGFYVKYIQNQYLKSPYNTEACSNIATTFCNITGILL